MARRRSVNRRWSRRSGNNTMELNQDSELIDDDVNPVWWKGLEDTTMHGPSTRTSLAEITPPILSADSLANDSELHDRWWDNLDRTSLQSSRRFSTRKSINPETSAQDSIISEDADDVSIKKRKVLLRARQKQNDGTEKFMKAFDDSDVAHSEPVPSKKRRTRSPAKSDAEFLQSNTRSRHSRSLADVERGDTSINTSNDTDVVIKARPKAFKKRATKVSSGVYDDILAKAGPSEINTSKNATRFEVAKTPEKVIDSNESGFMGPPISGSHRKRLSVVSKTLNMTSDESEGDVATNKRAFRKKSKENTSFNPFDEILSGQLNESSNSKVAANKSSSSIQGTRLSKSLKQNQTIQVSPRMHAEGEPKDISELQLRENERTINEETIGNEKKKQGLHERDRRSSTILSENSRNSKRRTRIEEAAVSEWEVPETQEDPRISTTGIKTSTMIEESIDLDEFPESREIDRRSVSSLKNNSRNAKRRTAIIEEAVIGESDVPESQGNVRKSMRSMTSSTMIEESIDVEELPGAPENYRRSSSLSKRNPRDSKRLTRHATIEEASMEDELSKFEEKSSKSTAKENSRDSKRRSDFKSRSTQSIQQSILTEKPSQLFQDWSDSEEEEKSKMPTERLSNVSQSSLIKKILNVSISRLPSPKIPHRQQIEDFDEDNEETNQEEMRKANSQSLKSHSRVLVDSAYELPDRERSASPIISASENESMNKSRLHDISRRQFSESKRETLSRSVLDETSNRTRKREIGSQEDREDSLNSRKDTFLADKSVSRKSIANTNISQQHSSDQSISEELAIGSQGSNLSLSRRNSRVERKVNDPKRSQSQYVEQSDDSNNEEEEHRSRKSNLSVSRKSSRVEKKVETRESIAPKNTSRQSGNSDESISEHEKHRSQKSNLSLSRKGSRVEKKVETRKSAAHKNISRQSGNLDESISEEDEHRSQKSNLSLSRKGSRVEKKVETRKSAAHKNISRQSGNLDESISEEDEHRSQKSSLSISRKSSHFEKNVRLRISAVPTNTSVQNAKIDESISDADTEIAENETSESRQKSLRAVDQIRKSRKSSIRPNASGKRVESDESISEEESNVISINQPQTDKSGASRKSSARPNISKQRIESDESISEQESNLKSINEPSKDKSGVSRKSFARPNTSKQRVHSRKSISEEESGLKSKLRLESDESGLKEDAENARFVKITNLALDKDVNKTNQLTVDISSHRNATNYNKSTFSTDANIDDDTSTTIPSEPIPVTPILTKLPQNSSSLLNKSNTTRAQKNITDFFPSKFLQKTDNSKLLASFTSLDKEKLDLVKKEVEMKRRQMTATRNEEVAKKKVISVIRQTENAMKSKKLHSKENAPKETSKKPPKVVDKAYIVNGQVYKRPKLPRPKPWVTDRLYRHLWKQLEPTYNLRTRIKSESFVESLAEVVALTIRRKKYDSYKHEVDALMKEMARLKIIKTRHDFYDFCYEYLPYDFRVKVTPMLLPGNVRNVPYDPATLHTPILPE